MPYALGTRPRFVLQGIARQWQRRVSYQVRSDVRGRFEIGPLTIRIADPFGLIELRRMVPGTPRSSSRRGSWPCRGSR